MRHLSTCVHNIGVQTRPWRDTRTTRDATEHKTYNLLATTTTPHLTAHTENSIQEHATDKKIRRVGLYPIFRDSEQFMCRQTVLKRPAHRVQFRWLKKSAWPQTCGHVIRCLNICVGLVGIYYTLHPQDTIDNCNICFKRAFVYRKKYIHRNRLSFNCITWFACYFMQKWIKFRV